MAAIALLGYGTVGRGVAEVLHKNAASITKKAAEEIHIKYIMNTHDLPGDPCEHLLVHNFEEMCIRDRALSGISKQKAIRRMVTEGTFADADQNSADFEAVSYTHLQSKEKVLGGQHFCAVLFFAYICKYFTCYRFLMDFSMKILRFSCQGAVDGGRRNALN